MNSALPFVSQLNVQGAEIEAKLTKVDQLINELIFALVQEGMSYKQAEEEAFRELKSKGPFKESEDHSGLAPLRRSRSNRTSHADYC